MNNATIQDWKKQLADAAYTEGRHIPASWSIEFEDGKDGCMPSGQYLMGLDRLGMYIDFPIRHEYGPFATVEEAAAFQSEVDAALVAI